ncbi:MAG: efflux RND transporter periplasmic adaptor subunit [Bryobacteraceae bacterium]|nr:efflux RND transporter periplasmic adaptor subunit [Bryobacteraceae bacterium]
MKLTRIILLPVLVAIGILIGFGYGRWYGPRESAGIAKQAMKPKGYHCPMHPSYHSDKPGDCPICGMKLVPDEDSAHPVDAAAQKPTGTILFYRDPKAPNFKFDKPGINPETGSDLEPVYENDPAAMPMGTIRVSPEKQQVIGVKFGEVTSGAGTHTFRSVGKVTMDETRFSNVQTRIEGWIDKVYVDFTGKLVEKGQPLLTLYSPEMLASQQEYLLAIRSREIMKDSPLAGSQQQSDSLLVAARKRLELFSLSEAQIEEITRSGKPLTYITIYSPISGFVMMRNAFPKQRITPETELYTIVDLSKVWIMADVFESEASMIRVGMPARVSLSYGSGGKINGRVSYIQPEVDPTTRTLKVRIEADNPDMRLRPDMFVDVDFSVAMSARMTVPAEAVLDTGLKKTVFVDRGNGYIEPRQVETGERIGDRIEITKGLTASERIVISGNFLIDSESQLKSSAAGMAGHQHGGATSAPAPSTPAPSTPAPAAGEHKKHD